MKRFVTKVSALSCEILIRELNNNFIQESENIPARASRHPIYISISDVRKGLSGKYNFHSLQDRVSVFIRDGEKIDGLNNLHPYYLTYHQLKHEWYIQPSEYFEEGKAGGFLMLESTGL